MKTLASIAGAALAAVLAAAVSACSGPAAATGAGQETTELRYQGSANNVTLPELAQDLGFLGDVKLVWVGNTTSGPQDIQSAATGQTDFGGAFTGAVVKLAAAGAPVKAVVNYYGEDEKTFNGFYVKDDSPIRTARDLIGRKVAVNTLGAHSEAVLDTWLEKNGLTPEEIRQVQLVVLPPNDTEEAVRRGQVDVGVDHAFLQDHAIATGGLRSLFSDYALFGAFNGGQYVLRDDFIAKHPAAVKEFVTGVAKAIEWERTTPRETVIERFTQIIEKRNRGESTKNLKYWKSVGVPRAGIITDTDFTRWDAWLNRAGIVGGPITPSKYYTNEFNDLAKG